MKVEAIKINNSEPAPLLTLITGPSKEAINAGDTKKELAERYQVRLRFWTALLGFAKEKTKLHANISPGQHNWVGTPAGLPYGINLNYVVRRNDAQVELYIDTDRESGEGNKKIFQELFERKSKIEEEFGEPLEWESLETKRACRIKKVIPIGGYQDEAKWQEAHVALVDAMIRLDRVFRPYLDQIDASK